MTIPTALQIFLAVILAGGIAIFQYYYKTGARGRTFAVMAALRFITVLALLLLLINPVISSTSYEVEKAILPILTDNSSSIKVLGAEGDARDLRGKLLADERLRARFDVRDFLFSDGLTAGETPSFDGTQTNLDQAARNLRSIGRGKSFPTIIITDGNQTAGSDYPYSFNPSNKVYPVILGDTATFTDLRITRLNVNKYAFLKNKFPVEVFLSYSGSGSRSADFTISGGGGVLARQKVSFSPSAPTAVLNLLLPADKIGVQVFRAQVTSSEREKNTYNNTKNFAVEIIDQRTEVAIVSAISHPDLAAIKRSIETNAQRKATIVKPSEVQTADYNVAILYQPTAVFAPVFDQLRTRGNSWIITGMATDFSFLNRQQDRFSFSMSQQPEDYLPEFSSNFGLFAAEDIGFGGMPPLQHPFGTVNAAQGMDIMLGSRVRNISTGLPMLAFVESQGRRQAFLLGENIWKWRMQAFKEKQSFEEFDRFVDRIVQFLSTDSARKSLVVDFERFYNSGDQIQIGAQYFDKNYEFDPNARLTLSLTNRATKAVKFYEMLRGANAYKANLQGLPAGKYDFSVRETRSNSVQNGYFEVLDFDIEKQFVNPDVMKLNQLASQTGGKSYLPRQADELVANLLSDDAYKPVQRAVNRRTPLIQWEWLLFILAAALGTEWFLRKYNGML